MSNKLPIVMAITFIIDIAVAITVFIAVEGLLWSFVAAFFAFGISTQITGFIGAMICIGED